MASHTLEQTAVVEVTDLRMRYGTNDVLHGVGFTINRGEVLVLLGPNGAGKTTTIEILEGFRLPSAGNVSVLGENPATADEQWRARIGVVLQSWRDHGRWRVWELLDHLGSFYLPYSEPHRQRPYPTDELIETVGLTEHRNKKVSALSGGQRRRLDVAIGIVGRPELLFLDEPTAGFDPTARRDFHDLVHRLSDLQDTAVLLTTHDLDEAEKLADTHVSVALFMLPGLLALQIVFSGAYGMATQLATEREDGTLLRLKSIPGGMTGYVVGQMLRTTLEIAF